MKKPELSIAICTLGFESLYNTLKSIEENKNKHNIEVLVIGKLGEELKERLKEFEFKHFDVSFKKGDLSEKRNLGLKEAKADIVAFIDDDVKLAKDWFENGIRHFKDKQTGIVSGPGLVPKKQDGASFLMRLFGNTFASIGAGPIRRRYKQRKEIEEDLCGDKIIGCNMIVLRKLYTEIGGFNPEIIPAEENDFANRAIKKSYKVYMDPEFNLIHFSRSNFFKFFKQVFRFGKAKINSMRRKAQPVKLEYYLPMLAVLGFPMLVAAAVFSGIIAKILIACIIMYLYFIFFCSVVSIAENKSLSNILLVITIPLMHFAYGLGELYEFIFGIKSLKHENSSK